MNEKFHFKSIFFLFSMFVVVLLIIFLLVDGVEVGMILVCILQTEQPKRGMIKKFSKRSIN